MHAEDRHRLVVLGQLVDQIAGGAGREALRRHQHAVVALRPANVLQRLATALLLDVDQLVEGPHRALVVLDHQRAERDGLAAMRMIDRAARLAVHARDLAVLGLVVGDDGREVVESCRF